MPFCQVSRLTTHEQRRVVGVEAEARLDRPAVRQRAPFGFFAENGAARCGSVAGFQTAVSMPLTMPKSVLARARISPSSPMP